MIGEVIFTLVKNYFNSKPDSLYDNPYWSRLEKQILPDFDLSRVLVYQFPSNTLLKIFKPLILSINKKDSVYEIRTALLSTGKNNFTQNPWTILLYRAVKEEGKWVLSNYLSSETKHWNSEKLGNITFHYPEDHIYSYDNANKSVSFCDSTTKQFGLEAVEFDFYIARSADEMGRLLNCDFFFAGYTDGKSYSENKLVFSGIGSEWFPHEIVHVLFREYRNVHRLVDEGTATWIGGLPAGSLSDLIKKNTTLKNFSFNELLNFESGNLDFYITGGILCKYIFENYGLDGFKKMLVPVKTNDELYRMLESTYGLDQTKLNQIIKDGINIPQSD